MSVGDLLSRPGLHGRNPETGVSNGAAGVSLKEIGQPRLTQGLRRQNGDQPAAFRIGRMTSSRIFAPSASATA